MNAPDMRGNCSPRITWIGSKLIGAKSMAIILGDHPLCSRARPTPTERKLYADIDPPSEPVDQARFGNHPENLGHQRRPGSRRYRRAQGCCDIPRRTRQAHRARARPESAVVRCAARSAQVSQTDSISRGMVWWLPDHPLESEVAIERATPYSPRKASRACPRALKLASLGPARLRCGVAAAVLPANLAGDCIEE